MSLHPRVNAALATPDEAWSWVRASARTAAAWRALETYQQQALSVLLFVRNRAMQRTLARVLELTFGLRDVPILNGEVVLSRRMGIVTAFKDASGFRVLIISTEVGGAGWNLQFTARAIILERPYNPATEAQMIGRVHRLGQPPDAEVVIPLGTLPTMDSHDVLLDCLLATKVQRQTAVLAPAAAFDVKEGLGARMREALGGTE